MKTANIDTVRIRECGQEIVELSKGMNTLVNELFDRICKMSDRGIWIGESANQFISEAQIDKIQYLNMKDSIYNYGKYLIDYADSMDKTIGEVREQ